jgi:peptidoglycan/LPS O-acetylase OafA/YrhL
MPEPVEGSRPYLAGLDGIRAIAVLGVVAYHVGAGWATGGLLGVGVFFVLSGYLITDLLVAEYRQRHAIDLGQFWLRRARRLLPALFLMLFVVIGWATLFDRVQLGALRDDLPSAVAYYSNWWFIHQHISYFARFGPPTPFGHLWSLAIEEQFYLLWPLLLLVGLRFARRRRLLITLVLTAAIGSAIEMAVLYVPFGDPTRVYDGTDTRAFALLIGAALALAWPRDLRIARLTEGARRVLDTAGSCALIGIVVLFCTAGEYETFLYRGGMVLCAIFSAVLIAVTIHPGARFARLLGIAPLAWVGKRSYGIYLWSYPVIVLTTPANKSPGALRAVIDIAITFGLAALSWSYIEEPIRHGALQDLWRRVRIWNLPRPNRLGWLVGSLASVNVVLCIVGLSGLVTGPSVAPQSTVTAILPTGSSSSGATTTSEPKGPTGSNVTVVTTATTPPPPKGAGILAIGDSVMIDAAPYLRKLLPGIAIDALVGQQLYQVQDDVAKLRREGVVGNRLVLELGTNGPYSLIALNNLIRSFGPMEKVVLINTLVGRPWEQFVNQTIAAEAKKHSNITVVNWFVLGGRHPAYLYPDGIHLLPTGAQYYAGLIAAAVAVPANSAPAKSPPETKLLSCAGTAVAKPSSFVISCADGYIELTRTHWSSWSKDIASGTTDFGMNACEPTCAASTMSYFPNSQVRLSKPITTKYGGVYSSLVVHYKLSGKEKAFSFEWKSGATV